MGRSHFGKEQSVVHVSRDTLTSATAQVLHRVRGGVHVTREQHGLDADPCREAFLRGYGVRGRRPRCEHGLDIAGNAPIADIDQGTQ